MLAIKYEAELSKLQQRNKKLLEQNDDLTQRNQELENEIKRLKELLNSKGASKGRRSLNSN